jgi:DNA gyrase inhibitor GyrI
MMGAAWDDRDNLPPANYRCDKIVSAIALKSKEKLGAQKCCPAGGIS